ncbi:DUF3861 family protein [Xanthomonas hortorum]|uniref:DUF3861 domain-containing protein n=2 Tax=Xanthomonas hortorum TaxID=56454 RepID=A0A9X4BU93_9XANT|nr:DUF3861 family protein [Xanthomonas hortorum]MCE4372782.1 DUF3861 domain-containing protein [Xanthomonas hortorum pv. hederae]MDC8639741.1 DUF3861 domain-containing protein [Xanthomonas hortorum pv. hederae]NHF64499.1 DUF3861 domain-containing protein [Xanthomonas hortorum]PPU78980.1 DUF3861 domain-containing protein [Xanthomonas hortorum pv. hederae]PUE98657.1 DUF3861 domain-containing protein [Xanthomonas hortorum pv. hederae]
MPRKRYRITVTPIESDGRPCDDRCTIEFEQRSRADWMRLLEELHLRRDLSSDECAALTVGSQLLEDLAARPRAQPSDALDALRPKLQLLLERLQRVHPTPGA